MKYFNLDIPIQPQDHKIIGNVLVGADVLAIAEIAEQYSGLTVVVTPDTKSAVRFSLILMSVFNLVCRSPFFLIGKPCLMIIFRPTKILLRHV